MGGEAQKLYETVSHIIEMRKMIGRLSPTIVANEGMAILDPDRVSIPIVYIGCHLQLRQIARQLCRGKFESNDDIEEQHDLFPELQKRYPSARSARDVEPEYVLLELLSVDDWKFNVRRLRSEGRQKLKHGDALEAWGVQHFNRAREPELV